jgi:hypothetical protein
VIRVDASYPVQYVVDVFKTIGRSSYYIDMQDSDFNYRDKTGVQNFKYSGRSDKNQLGIGTLETYGVIPQFSQRPWNELTSQNVFPYTQDGVAKTASFGQPEFLTIGAPFLFVRKAPTFTSPDVKVDTAEGRSLVVFLSKESNFRKGKGFITREIAPTISHVATNGDIIADIAVAPFPCSVAANR